MTHAIKLDGSELHGYVYVWIPTGIRIALLPISVNDFYITGTIAPGGGTRTLLTHKSVGVTEIARCVISN